MLFKKKNEEQQVTDNQTELVRITDIIIPDDYSKTRIGYHKLRWAKEYYQRNGKTDKPITVIAETNEKGLPNKLLLVDEYSRYKAAVDLGIYFVLVRYIDIDTYCNVRNI